MKPSSKPPYSSNPPYSSQPPGSEQGRSHKALDKFLNDLLPNDLKILRHYLTIMPEDFNLGNLMVFRNQFGEQFDLLAARVDELTQIYGCSLDAIRRVLLLRMDEKKEEMAEIRGELQKAIVPSENELVDAYANTMLSGKPPPSSPQTPAESNESVQEVREAVISRGCLNAEMSSQEFVDRLTDEGKEMLRELLLLGDIKDAATVKALEKQHGKIGFVKLSMHVVDRICVAPSAKKELCEALKGDDEERAPFSVGAPSRPSPWAVPKSPGVVARSNTTDNFSAVMVMDINRPEPATEAPSLIELGSSVLSVNEFVDALSKKQKVILKELLALDRIDKADIPTMQRLGNTAWELMYVIHQLHERLQKPLDDIKNDLSIKLDTILHPKVIINPNVGTYKRGSAPIVQKKRGILARFFRNKS